MKDFISKYWPSLIVLFLVIGCAGNMAYSSFQKKLDIERQKLEQVKNELENEKEKRRRQHIEDSIKATPAYIDSVAREERYYVERAEKRRQLENIELVGFVYKNDTVYHSSFHPTGNLEEDGMIFFVGFTVNDIKQLRFITNQEAEDLNLHECKECSEKERVYLEYEDGELVSADEAYDKVDD